MEGAVVCHCSTCRGEVEQTVRTRQRHLQLYGSFVAESEGEDEVCSCPICKGEVVVSTRSRQRHTKNNSIGKRTTSSGTVSETSDNETSDNETEAQLPSSMEDNNDEDECEETASEDEAVSGDDSWNEELPSDPICEHSPITQLDIALALLRWFSKFPGISKAAVGDLLSLLQKLISLAVGQVVTFPTSFRRARSLINHYLTESQGFEICHNECILYTGDNSHATECPKCGEERRGHLPSRKYSTIPIIPRLQNIFKSSELAKLIKCHVSRQEGREDDDLVFDLHDTQFWREMYSEEGPLDGDPRNILLAFSADPVHPFKGNPQYSMCPVSLQILNFPKPVRSSDRRILLWSILPGPKKPKSLTTYLRPLVDELLLLKQGVRTLDVESGEWFTLKAMCVLNILDYEGQQMFLNTLGQNAIQGCNKCRQTGVYLPVLEKTVYTDSRRFLPLNHPLRSESGPKFPFSGIETRQAPQERSQEQQHQYGVAYETAQANGANKSTLRTIAKSTGVKGIPAFDRLPYFNAILDVVAEPMHMIARIGLLIVQTMTCVAPMDGRKVRAQEAALGRFGDACEIDEDEEDLPQAPWSLSRADTDLADERREQVMAPVGFGFRPVKMFNSQSNLKSHDWFQAFSSGILKYCLRGMLDNKQRHALFNFIDAVGNLQRAVPGGERAEHLLSIQEALTVMEMEFPVSLQVVLLHLFQHLPSYIQRFGDVHSIAMFPIERYQHFLVSRIHNRRYPEACVMETYKVLEATENALEGPNVSEDVRAILQEEDTANEGTRSFLGYVTGRKGQTCTFGRKVTVSLDRRRHQQLVKCYKENIPALQEVDEVYDKYKDAERRRGRIPTSMANWTPPSTLRTKYGDVLNDLLTGPPTVGNKRSKATLVDKERGMLIHLRCSEEEDNLHSLQTRSSYIKGEFLETEPPTDRHYIGDTPSGEDKFIYFGRIQYFFVQEYAGETRELAYVNWFKPPFYEEEVKMWRVDTSLGFYKWLPYVFLHQIESQVVVAKDGRNLWILSPV